MEKKIFNIKLYCLRDRKTHRILNVGYSEDGLKYTFNKVGKCLYNEASYVDIYQRKSFSTIKSDSLRNSLEKSENYYANKALILSK
jgi:hypothetical protein